MGVRAFSLLMAAQLPSLYPQGAGPKKPRVDPALFEGAEGCFVLYDMAADRRVAVFGEKRCAERYTACSTFKVPLALMAFDAGVLKYESTLLKWDGVSRFLEAWNRDQTARSWMQNSVVWYSQRLTPLLGKERIAAYLKSFQYGNEDFSGGLTSAWLTITRSDSDPGGGTLKISAFEQLEFLKRFWRNQLPVSADALARTRNITFLENSPGGFALHGKTGSGVFDDSRRDFGWFIGHIAGNGGEYVFVAGLTRDQQAADARAAGMAAREISRRILRDNGLW